MRSTWDETKSRTWGPIGAHDEMHRRRGSEPPECEGKVYLKCQVDHAAAPAGSCTLGQCARCKRLLGFTAEAVLFDVSIGARAEAITP